MLSKKTLFLIILFLAVFFPFIASAGEYPVKFCQWVNKGGADSSFDDGDDWDWTDKDKGIKNCPADKIATASYDGFVPCGKCVTLNGSRDNFTKESYITSASEERCGKSEQIYINCQLCHIFTMLNGIISFMLTKIIPPLAVLMLIIGGVMFYFGGAKPDLISRGSRLIVGVAIGLFLIYGAYMILGLMLKIAGAADVNPVKDLFKNGVFSIECPIEVPGKIHGSGTTIP